MSPLLQKEAEALPASGATWHRAAHAIVSLAKASPADVRTLLPRFVGHPTWQVRVYAARAAGATGAIEALVRLGDDAQDNVRKAALDELARLKRPEALAVAYEALTRPDYQLVMTAARALAAETDRAQGRQGALVASLAPHARGQRHVARSARGDPDALAEIGSASDVDAVVAVPVATGMRAWRSSRPRRSRRGRAGAATPRRGRGPRPRRIWRCWRRRARSACASRWRAAA